MPEITYADDTVGWYAILVQPQRETRVIEWLATFGVYSFFPVEKKWRIRRAARRIPGGKILPDGRVGYFHERSILPGYVFSKFSGLPRWHIIRDMPNITGALGHMGKPICLSYSDLETLHDLRHRAHDLNAREEERRKIVFAPGEIVRISEHSSLDGFVKEITAIDAGKEVAYLRDLCILGKPLPIPYAMLSHVAV